MRLILLGLVVIITSLNFASAQWTEPVPMDPQFGTAIRAPWISNDGLRLYLCTIDYIFVTSRASVDSAWGPLSVLPPHINASPTQNSACESPSGDTLYFTSDSDQRPEGGFGWYDVYYSVRTDTGWGPTINCGDSVNGPGREWSVGMSRDGSMLLLSSNGSNGEYISHKLWYSRKRPDGTWGQLVLLGDSLNTWMDEENPSLSPDNTHLFFYRNHSLGRDLFESRLVGGGWQTPTPLPSPVNDPLAEEMNPCVANDGRTLWFRSDRTGQNQIYTSVDTTVLSTSPRGRSPNRSDSRTGGLRVYQAGDGVLGISLPYSVSRLTNLVTVYDLLGRKVANVSIPFLLHGGETTGSLSVGDLPVGMYVISVQLRDQTLNAKYISLK